MVRHPQPLAAACWLSQLSPFQSHLPETLMANPTTTLTFTEAQLERLVDCLDSREEALPLENGVTVTERDDKEHNMLTLRLYKALERIQRKPRRANSQRVHVPKIEALLNELL